MMRRLLRLLRRVFALEIEVFQGLRPRMERVETISEAELAARFLEAPNSPLFAATLAVLDQATLEALDEALDEAIPNEVMRFRVGKAAGLLELKEELQRREAEARKREAEARLATGEE